MISETTNASVSNCNINPPITTWDGHIICEWKLISIPLGVRVKRNKDKIDRSSIHWQPPQLGFVKLNFDGASRGNPGKFGIGACIRNCKGFVLAISMAPLPFGTKI